MRKWGNVILLGILFYFGTLANAADSKDDNKKQEMKPYQAKYHILITDLKNEEVLESMLRINAMAESYYRRTKGFAGKITKKLPFYLYGRRQDYVMEIVRLTGNPAMGRSAGVYNGESLRATADKRAFSKKTIWRIVQHEGFHQFAHKVIAKRGKLPVWLNEGLAEYFSEAIWTGDSLVAGIIPDGREYTKFRRVFSGGGRMGRVQESIKNKSFKPWKDMVTMKHEEWVRDLNGTNYDQAWSMVHFLVHGNDGKYANKFGSYISDCANGKRGDLAFAKRFGRNITKIEEEYKKWWLGLKKNPSENVYNRAQVETLMSFLARYHQKNRQTKYESAEAFFKAAKEGKLAFNPRKDSWFWLPNDILETALNNVDDVSKWKLVYNKAERPELSYTCEDGTVIEATYQPRGSKKTPDVKITIEEPKPAKTKESSTLKKKTPTF